MASRRYRKPCTYSAFVPDRLTDLNLLLPGDVSADLADAERDVVRLNLSHQHVADLESLARVLLRAEAVASSRIEGLTVGHRRLLRHEAAQQSGVALADVTAEAVLGNVSAMQTAVDLAIKPGDIDLEDLLAIHRVLMEHTDHPEYAGVARKEQNWISGQTPCVADFVPPPHETVLPLLDDLCAFLNSDDMPALAQAALAHAQFETIHPFLDGNGRAGRALVHVVLRRRGLTPHYVPPISLALATTAGDYIAGLTAFRHVGDPESREAQAGIAEWLATFATATRRACAEAERLADGLGGLQAAWREAVKPRRNSAADLLLQTLGRAPVLTASTAAAIVHRSSVATGKAIDQLVAAGVLQQITVGRRNRAYEAPGVFDLLVDHERAVASPSGDTLSEPPVRPVPDRRRN
jgi:Fic family protein